jgi:putative transposase
MAQNYYAELYFHFVWQTKGRLKLIKPDIQNAVWGKILEKSREYGGFPVEIGGIEDHVHLLVSTPPTVLLSEFIGKVKGSTSHFVNTELNASCRFHWGEGYGVLSLAKKDCRAVAAYIKNQRQHHARNSPNAKMERIDPNAPECE